LALRIVFKSQFNAECKISWSPPAGHDLKEKPARRWQGRRHAGSAGTDKSRLLSVQVWLKTMDDFDAMNAVYDAWVVSGNAPMRACGKVELADPAYRIEVIAIAARS
jgi:hypothetical protein